MDGLNINGIVQGLLSNPEMMQSIMSLVGNLNDETLNSVTEGKHGEEKEQKAGEGFDLSSIISLIGNKEADNKAKGGSNGNNHPNHPCPADRKALLLALKPFLGSDRRDKIDFILNILSLLDVAESLGFTNLKL